ncbi:MAG: sugar phosphate isomerase/epimerase [Spirochaetales bacterium]|nr:sugar phosphate isomerase/epimerase [Spirochaetales bacterium]
MKDYRLKHAIITGFLGQTADRFRTYQQAADLEHKFRTMARMEGINGVELVYPYEVPEPEVLKDLLSRYGLSVAAINVNIKKDMDFTLGSVTNPDTDIRRKAVDMVKAAKDYAASVGADKVQCCPLGDGYEYSFQNDYITSWKRLVEAFGEAGEYRREIPLFIEYKPNEIRGKCFIDSAAKTLCLLNELGNTALGVTLDFGHSVYGGENPAEALCLLEASPYPYYIHINDNDGQWDWDYMVATKHFIDYVEFLFYLQEFNYADYLTSDTSPTRQDIVETFNANARWTEKLWDRLLCLDRDTFKGLISGADFSATWKFLEEQLFFPVRIKT